MSGQGVMSVMIAGGGTGGHLFPGIALAEEFQKHEHDMDIVFVGTEHGIEAAVLPREGFTVEFVSAVGFMGGGLIRKVKSFFRMIGAISDSYRIITKYQPDVMIGLGGYASFATVLSGVLKGIPTLILEQNAVPGFANRVLGKFARAVCITYQESMSYFPKHKTFLTGNPIREKILRGSKTSALKIFGLKPDLFTVFIFGGSAGASSINKALVDALQYLLDLKEGVQFLHQTGEKDYEFVRDAYRSYGFSGMVSPFIFQMAEAYAVSDMVVSRAGATTLSEITALGKPAVLIPYPFAAANHQEVNARKMEQMQAALLILDRELNGRMLAGTIRELHDNQELREKIRKNSGTLGQPRASQKVFTIALSVARKGPHHV
ncbi:MAG: undecaprenyldiphospho-muramoylpentapeptide beta-N-acetylglucosaminyltransferase [bacterium]